MASKFSLRSERIPNQTVYQPEEKKLQLPSRSTSESNSVVTGNDCELQVLNNKWCDGRNGRRAPLNKMVTRFHSTHPRSTIKWIMNSKFISISARSQEENKELIRVPQIVYSSYSFHLKLFLVLIPGERFLNFRTRDKRRGVLSRVP